MSHFTPVVRRPTHRRRSLRLEPLENRYLLSHPAVAAVNVASTQWAPSFVSYLESSGLGTGGYAIPVGSAAQLQTLPWTNINQIRITFTENVVVAAADLSVSGVNTTAYAFSGFSYDPTTYTATWTLNAPIGDDKLALDLDASGLAPIQSAATGEVLDGAWTDGQSTFPSGNGQGGTDFHFCFNVLPGDVNQSGGVGNLDTNLVLNAGGQVIGDPGYSIFYDVNGGGKIGNLDANLVRNNGGSVLPSGNPPGMTNDAPTTSGIPDLSVVAGTVDQVLTLTDFFADAQTPPPNLVYSVVQNTNPSLFNSLAIDSSNNLTLTFASGATGDAVLTIRATDSVGLIVDATLATHVRTAPVISNFYCINDIGDYWTLTGVVTDADDPVQGDVVTFGGVLASYNLTATVGQDGTFSVTSELIGLQMGTGTAQTADPQGVLSNLAQYWVIA
jgi:hypothetical protein